MGGQKDHTVWLQGATKGQQIPPVSSVRKKT